MKDKKNGRGTEGELADLHGLLSMYFKDRLTSGEPISPSELKAQLDALDAKYLTPRVLAGLATGDSFAQIQWQQYQTEAAPIRAQIVALGFYLKGEF